MMVHQPARTEMELEECSPERGEQLSSDGEGECSPQRGEQLNSEGEGGGEG